jgi:hypothetical protein
MNDLRLALRQLGKRPGFAAVIVLTLGLGIGVNTAVFSVVEAVLLRPLPYRNAEHLALLWHRRATGSAQPMRIPAPDVADYRARTTSFDDFAFTTGTADVALGDDGRASHARVGRVTSNFFSVLGVRPQLGRTFEPGEGLVAPDAFSVATRRSSAKPCGSTRSP